MGNPEINHSAMGVMWRLREIEKIDANAKRLDLHFTSLESVYNNFFSFYYHFLEDLMGSGHLYDFTQAGRSEGSKLAVN